MSDEQDNQFYVCAVCGSPLNVTDIDGERTIAHPNRTSIDHEPDPVLGMLPDPAKMQCDFCSQPEPIYVFPTENADRTTSLVGGRRVLEIGSSGWASCAPCADYIDRRDIKALVRRVVTKSPTVQMMVGGLGEPDKTLMLRQVRDSLRGRYEDFLRTRTGPKVDLR